jgi:methionine synthase I (cobalamin-dependent)
MTSRALKKPAAKSRKPARAARATGPGLKMRVAKGPRPHGAPRQGRGDLRRRVRLRARTARLLCRRAPSFRRCSSSIPEVVEQLHRDFVHAGSDVTQALTYYVHREKLRVIGREKDLLPMNRMALSIAKKVARETGTLFAGDICNTNVYDPADKKALKEVNKIFAEQVGWAADAGVDYIVAETYSWGAEALLALEAIRKYSKVPAVITVSIHREEQLRDGWSAAEACKRLEDAGAEVVGLNCHRGPATMMPLIREIRKAVKCHVAALPVPYRTTPGAALIYVADRSVLRRCASVSHWTRSLCVHALGNVRLRARGVRARRQLSRHLLRRRATPYSRTRRRSRPTS